MYATADLHNRYKQDAVKTASPIDLIIMLYDGCIKQLKLAQIYLDEEEPESPRNFLIAIEKAEEILLELIRSLNMKVDISNDLMDLYQFMISELVQVTFSKEKDRIDPVIDMMTTLRESWEEVKKSSGTNFNVGEELQG